MCNTALGEFCMTHDNWEELLTQAPYSLKISEDSSYVMFKYNQIESDFNNPIVREARGIIFRKGEWDNPVCWAFNKFGNYGEGWVEDIDWSTAFVSEKIDGSLMKVWWDGEWKISTNGTIDAYKAELGDARMTNFGKYFTTAILQYYPTCSNFLCELDTDLTYMFELVGPYNRIVIPYDEPAIYFLGARNKYTGEEFNCSTLVAGSLNMGRFHLPKQYPLTSIDDCVDIAGTLSWDNEGFVACDAQFNRVKIKSPAYVMAHFARNNNVITRKHLINIVVNNEIEEFLCYASDYKAEIDACKALIDKYYIIADWCVNVCQKARKLPRNEYAALVKTFPVIFQGLLFKNYDKVVTAREFTANWTENKWEEHLEALEKLKENFNLW